MKATELVRKSLDGAKMWLLGLVQDVKGSPLIAPTPRGGNHPLWVVGHLALAEATLVSQYILGQGKQYPEWEPLFGTGSQPTPDASKYPSMDKLLAELEKVRARTLEVLGSMSDEDLSKPSKAPADRAAMFGTVGQCFSMISHHMTFHAGQVADARRALGKAPVFA